MNNFKTATLTLLGFCLAIAPVVLIGQQMCRPGQPCYQGNYGTYEHYQGVANNAVRASSEVHQSSYSQPEYVVSSQSTQPVRYVQYSQPVQYTYSQPVRVVSQPTSNYGAGYATGQRVNTVVRTGLFGLRRRVVSQDAGFMGTTRQIVRVTRGVRGQWVFYANGSRQWQWYR
jgi:hypothetical protein